MYFSHLEPLYQGLFALKVRRATILQRQRPMAFLNPLTRFGTVFRYIGRRATLPLGFCLTEAAPSGTYSRPGILRVRPVAHTVKWTRFACRTTVLGACGRYSAKHLKTSHPLSLVNLLRLLIYLFIYFWYSFRSCFTTFRTFDIDVSRAFSRWN